MKSGWDVVERHWANMLMVLLGLWLIASPWALGLTGGAIMWNAVIVGALLVIVSTAAILAFHRWEEWINAALGIWLIGSPWVLGFTVMASAMWSSILTGLVVTVLAIWTATHVPATGGPARA